MAHGTTEESGLVERYLFGQRVPKERPENMSIETMVRNLWAGLVGKIDSAKLGALLDQLESATTEFSFGIGRVDGFLFSARVTVEARGRTFNGDAGGLLGLGGFSGEGTLYADDMDALFQNTEKFSVNLSDVSLGVLFLDGSDNVLGHFDCGGIGTLAGWGAGTGSWS